MEKLAGLITRAKLGAFLIISVIMLVCFSLPGLALPGSTSQQDQGQSSQAEQSSAYLQGIEKDPNGVPNSSVWYAQPWIWAIVASILILVIGLLFKSYGKRDVESEHGI